MLTGKLPNAISPALRIFDYGVLHLAVHEHYSQTGPCSKDQATFLHRERTRVAVDMRRGSSG